MTSIINQLRQAIESCGLSDCQLAESSGVSQPTITRFRNRSMGISFENAAKIAAALGLELRPVRKGRA